MAVSKVLPWLGSSPPTRGTHLAGQGLAQDQRFIPAYAGNTDNQPRASPQNPVHPRLRGEHLTGFLARSELHGSSPPTRGTPFAFYIQSPVFRFIPAYAGNTI